MQQGRGAVTTIAPTETVEDCLRETSLKGEQRRAVAIAATTPDQVMAWKGVAGAGKTYALKTLKELAQDQGYAVRGFAPSAEAAHGLSEVLGIETETVAELLVAQTPEQLQQSTLWIVDKAGLLSMKDAHALLRRASLEQARVLLVGDTRQLSAVEAGNPFKSLQAGGITTAYLELHRRQQSQVLKFAVEKVAQGGNSGRHSAFRGYFKSPISRKKAHSV